MRAKQEIQNGIINMQHRLSKEWNLEAERCFNEAPLLSQEIIAFSFDSDVRALSQVERVKLLHL